jgi:hypothetical protein
MGLVLKAFEVMGTIDEQRRLHLEEPLPIIGPIQVRVIILIPEESDIDDQEWLRAAAMNPTFDFLKDPKEDIYTFLTSKLYYFRVNGRKMTRIARRFRDGENTQSGRAGNARRSQGRLSSPPRAP